MLAYDVCAANDMPSALTCAMDSIALHWSDFADLAEARAAIRRSFEIKEYQPE